MRSVALFSLMLVAAALAATSAAGHPLPLVEAACHGEAPSVLSCTTGKHPYLGLPPKLGCGFEQTYVGTVVSHLSYANGYGGVSCTRHADGTLEGDAWGGASAPPALLEELQHDCYSFEPGTLGTLTPGGSGRFTCTISH